LAGCAKLARGRPGRAWQLSRRPLRAASNGLFCVFGWVSSTGALFSFLSRLAAVLLRQAL